MLKKPRAFVEGAILDLPQSAWSGAMENWFRRMADCISAERVFLLKDRLYGWIISVEEIDPLQNLLSGPRTCNQKILGSNPVRS